MNDHRTTGRGLQRYVGDSQTTAGSFMTEDAWRADMQRVYHNLSYMNINKLDLRSKIREKMHENQNWQPEKYYSMKLLDAHAITGEKKLNDLLENERKEIISGMIDTKIKQDSNIEVLDNFTVDKSLRRIQNGFLDYKGSMMTDKEKAAWGVREFKRPALRPREHTDHDLFKNMTYHQIINYKK